MHGKGQRRIWGIAKVDTVASRHVFQHNRCKTLNDTQIAWQNVRRKGDDIGALRVLDQVLPMARSKLISVIACAAAQKVIPNTADQRVIARTTNQRVIATSAVKTVACEDLQQVITCRALHRARQ